MNRQQRIQGAYEVVHKTMNLRLPQQEALARIKDVLLRLPRRLSECTLQERQEFLAYEAGWSHPYHPIYTLELATGVGKTRLMGGVIALLWLANEARTFLILAPRRKVLERIEAGFDPEFREYIFVSQQLVPGVTLVRGEDLEDPIAVETRDDEGPRIYLLSPQLITTSARFTDGTEFAAVSPADFLRNQSDLCVLVDESHHVGRLDAASTTAWAGAIRDLDPCLQLGFTATPRDESGTNLLYSYPLQQALSEDRFPKVTKGVKLWVRDFADDLIGTADLDRTTVDHALARLEIKERAIRASEERAFAEVKPVAVCFAKDTDHADAVAEWLVDTGRIEPEELLVTHSRRTKSEEEIEKLLAIEDPGNPVRVVVNVQELTEGWDVTNVYVVAPLRAMATFAGALQAMGRGLRLPAGKRVGDPQLDMLDVVVFGRARLADILDDATRWSASDSAIEVRDPDEPDVVRVSCSVPTRQAPAISYSDLNLEHVEPSLDIRPEALGRLTTMVVEGLELAAAQQRIEGSESLVRLDRRRFVATAAMRTIRKLNRHLSDERHFAPTTEVIDRWLDTLGTGALGNRVDLDNGIPFDPLEVGEEIARLIELELQRRPSGFEPSGQIASLSFPEYTISLESSATDSGEDHELVHADLDTFSANTSFRPRYPYGGWTRGLHPVYTFDSQHEANVALILDRSSVHWWVRNEPKRFVIPTPAGGFWPDFLAQVDEGSHRALYVIEVKGDIFWQPPESASRVKAAAAAEWCRSQTALGERWCFGVALESEIEQVNSLEALLPRLRAMSCD